MTRSVGFRWAVIVYMLGTARIGACQVVSRGAGTSKSPVVKITRGDVTAYSRERGKVVIGSLSDQKHGHVVVARPGTDRVWDGNTLGGFKDMLSGNKVSHQKVIDRMNLFINEGRNTQQGGKLDVTSATRPELQAYHDRYVENGAPVSHSWGPRDRQNVQWYQVPTDQNVEAIIRNYEPPAARSTQEQNLRCNDLVKKAAPVVERLVMDELAPGKGQPAPYVNANNIDAALKIRSAETASAAAQVTARPPEPAQTPIYETTPRELKVVPKPGGVILQAVAEIQGLDAKNVASAHFDPRTGRLTIQRRSGAPLLYDTDPADFVVAVRCIFDRQVIPTLSIENLPDNREYQAVNYTGPLFKTKFGKTLLDTDNLLGALIFAQEGEHRDVAAEVIPRFREMTCESLHTMSVGSRVYLRATGARFRIEGDRLVVEDVETKVDVEGIDYAAGYYQESLHRVARAIDRHFAGLAEQFEEFDDFRRLAASVALAQWIKRNAISFDWSSLQNYPIAAVDFPALIPSSEWYCLFNGRNLDGWKVNLPAGGVGWASQHGAVTIEPTGAKPVEVLASNWRTNYDVRYTVITDGPVEFIVRVGSGSSGASVRLDTQGRPQKVELFQSNGTWTAVAPGVSRTGKLTIPPGKPDEPRLPNDFGIRIPPGSKLTLFAAAVRGRN